MQWRCERRAVTSAAFNRYTHLDKVVVFQGLGCLPSAPPGGGGFPPCPDDPRRPRRRKRACVDWTRAGRACEERRCPRRRLLFVIACPRPCRTTAREAARVAGLDSGRGGHWRRPDRAGARRRPASGPVRRLGGPALGGPPPQSASGISLSRNRAMIAVAGAASIQYITCFIIGPPGYSPMSERGGGREVPVSPPPLGDRRRRGVRSPATGPGPATVRPRRGAGRGRGPRRSARPASGRSCPC